jgi:hypothetical protein
MRVSHFALAVCVAVLAGASVNAQSIGDRETANTLRASAGSAGPAATLDQMKWLVGHWKGTGLGGVSEEMWSEPAGGVMMGMYRLVVGGKPSFYEFLHLAEENGSLVMKLKHFDADLTAWEEKERFVTFRLVKIGANEAYFSGLTMRRSVDRLQIFLAIRDKDGKVREEEFRMERVR